MPADKEVVQKGVAALVRHAKLQKEKRNDLIETVDKIHLVVTLAKYPKHSDKPRRIPLPHPLHDEETEVCLITKDPQREYKDKIAEITPDNERSVVQKVIGVKKLKEKYKPYEAKRNLCKLYDVFLADARVIPMLPNLLGKAFFAAKKQPMAVNLTKKDLKGELRSALSSTSIVFSKGTTATVKVARVDMNPAQIVENVLAVMEAIATLVPKKWQGIRSFHVKTPSSVSLKVYNSAPEITKIT